MCASSRRLHELAGLTLKSHAVRIKERLYLAGEHGGLRQRAQLAVVARLDALLHQLLHGGHGGAGRRRQRGARGRSRLLGLQRMVGFLRN